MTIETQFTIGDAVTDGTRDGTVDQIRIDVLRVQNEAVPQIIYKVNFAGRVESHMESELDVSTD